jgi:FkbM family methyltransferase
MELIRGEFLPAWARVIYIRAMMRAWRQFARSEPIRRIPNAGLMRLRPWEYIETRLFFYRAWEPEITRFILRGLSQGDIAIDIGANVGYYSLLMSQAVSSSGKVYAVEPSRSICERLKRNIALNELSNVVVLNYGISNKAEERYFQLSGDTNCGTSHFVDGPNEGNIEGKLPLRRLVDVIPMADLGRATLIKIDVEGMEIEVLEDLLDILELFPAKITICVELRRDGGASSPADDIVRRFRKAGFVLYTIDNRYTLSAYAKGNWRQPKAVDCLPDGQHDLAFVRG